MNNGDVLTSLRLLKGYTAWKTMDVFSWRSFMYLLVFSQLITPLVSLLVWQAVTAQEQTVYGWSSSEFLVYYLAIIMVRQLTVSYEHHMLGMNIYTGEVTSLLLKPHHLLYSVIGENLAVKIVSYTVSIPLIIVLWMGFTPTILPSFSNVMLFVLTVVNASILRFLWLYLLTLTAFWTEKTQSIVNAGEVAIFFIGGEVAPLFLIHGFFGDAAYYLPFYGMMGFPAETLIGIKGISLSSGLLLQYAWICTLVLLCSWVYKKGIKRYSALGG
ncbi:ABC-2 family transporter protein [Jeotgalibacillus sp. ET6]|uniref:ABC transporter permease n=1 Tax=Jeotgalibacillus sp. ET6 TaxID=3037260 RepID=UPI0024184574|nr:ABC-2 family transporter protein [Jeotgalibacillus sp. ET6]MDG5471300.1 ABC-2 family transporter protein [Jeotgalibacillus sp. ET6]